MRRLPTLAVPLLFLALAPASRAVLISGYVEGTINQAFIDVGSIGRPFPFTVGASVYLAYQIETDRLLAMPTPGEYVIQLASFQLQTSDGFSGGGMQIGAVSPGRLAVINGPTDRVVIMFGMPSANISLVFTDPTGQAINSLAVPMAADLLRFPGVAITLARELALSADQFNATGVPVPSAADFPVPEPSTLAMGLVGSGLLGLACLRRMGA